MSDPREELKERLSDPGKIDFLAVLMRVARADDVSPVERDRLGPIAEWIGASEDQLAESVRRSHDDEVELSELCRHLDSRERRFLLFREACGVVWVDGKKSLAEDQLLGRLSLLLGLDDEARAVMDSPLACSPEGERRFLELLGGTSDL